MALTTPQTQTFPAGQSDWNANMATFAPLDPTLGVETGVQVTVSYNYTPATSTTPGPVLQTFTLQEMFGVSHPQQVVRFTPNPGIDLTKVFVVGPGGAAVVHQVMGDGTIAVLTDLPAGASLTFLLYQGSASPTTSNPVRLTTE